MSSEKYCLQWSSFQDNIHSSYRELRDNQDLADITLACKDGQNIEAHKIIISASSPVLRDIVMTNKHPHPLIYMRGVNAKNMNYIIDFMYYGEVNIFQEELEGFLELAEEIKLKGLHKTSFEKDEEEISNNTVLNEVKELKYNQLENLEQPNETIHDNSELVLAKNEKISMENSGIEELDERIENMMEKGINSWNCKVCGKSTATKFNMRSHIETHITGIEHPCTICGKVFRSRNSLHKHISVIHNKKATLEQTI